MKYSDLSDKERYEIIKLGVQNGITNLDDIEKAYNEYAEGGSLKQDDYYNNVVLQKDDEQKQKIKEQLEERRTYANGGKLNEIQSLFKSNPIEAKKMWDSLSDDDKKAYGVEGGFWNVVNDISYKFQDGGSNDKWYINYVEDLNDDEKEKYYKEYNPSGYAGFRGYLEKHINPNYTNISNGEQDEYYKAYLGLSNNVPKSSANGFNDKDIESKEYYGLTPRMIESIKASFDIKNLKRIYDNYDEESKWYHNLPSKKDLLKIINQAGNILSGNSHQFYGDKNIIKSNDDGNITNEIAGNGISNPLGMLADFGVVYDKDNKQLKVYDTYDFGADWKHAFSRFPKRKKSMEIRQIIPFDIDNPDSILKDYNSYNAHIPNINNDAEDKYQRQHPIYRNNKYIQELGYSPEDYDNYDYDKFENSGLTIGENGHYPDEFKKDIHPTSLKAGEFKTDINGNQYFDVSDWNLYENPRGINNTIFGKYEQGDGSVPVIYNGSYILPEMTVTPDNVYIHDTYDNNKIYYK